MPKPNEVLFRLHNVRTPEVLGVEVNQRNDSFLKEQHEKLGVLPGKKVLSTNVETDPLWNLKNTLVCLRQQGYTLLNMGVEIRTHPKTGKKKPVLSLNFGLVGETTCTEEQLEWAKEFFHRTGYELAQAYLNTRRDGSTQLAYDCINAVSLTGQIEAPLPVLELITLEVNDSTPA